MPNRERFRLNRVFHGLADPTRRAVVERLGHGPAPVSELARSSQMALPSFLQHLKVLEDCGLIHSTKTGRVRTCRLVSAPLRQAESWLEKQRAQWERRLDQLDAYLTHLKEKS
jgi:DNA-binding transcriptional ArsR family regulator